MNRNHKYIMYRIVTLLMCFVVSSCATIFSGTSQNVNIKVVDSATNDYINGCICVLNDPNGSNYTLSTNPAVVPLVRSNGPIIVRCKKAGYRQLNMAIGDSFNVITVANILFWPGFIIDAASGAYKKYPSHYVISMEKN